MAAVDENHAETWLVCHEEFKAVIGSHPSIRLLLEINEFPFAHEAGVFIDNTNELFITSNQFKDASGGLKVQISKICLGNGNQPVTSEEVACGLIHMANGGVNYDDAVLFCAQGSSTQPSGLFKMQQHPPYDTEPVITSYLGRPFNSINDVVIHADGSIWFTDPSYGHDHGYRPRPSLPNRVYRLNPVDGSVRAVADGFGRPNGICFSPDHQTVYVTDTDQVRGPSVDYGRSASMYVCARAPSSKDHSLVRQFQLTSPSYAFDIVHYHGEPFLTNRRLFAAPDIGIPDGIKCDTLGNIYSGCGDGVNVWSPGGILLGKILVSGGVANFCFGRNGQLFLLNENRIWLAQMDPKTKGALLGI